MHETLNEYIIYLKIKYKTLLLSMFNSKSLGVTHVQPQLFAHSVTLMALVHHNKMVQLSKIE